MYKNLIGEMAKNGITNKQISSQLKKSDRAVRNKINGISDFTWKEAVNIQQTFFPKLELVYLFAET